MNVFLYANRVCGSLLYPEPLFSAGPESYHCLSTPNEHLTFQLRPTVTHTVLGPGRGSALRALQARSPEPVRIAGM